MEWKEYCESKIPQIKASYLKFHQQELNLSNPVLFSEKLQWLKVYDSTFLKAFCADKLRVHDYYKAVLGKDIGVPVMKTYSCIDEFLDSSFTLPCILKCNHGSGMNMLITNDSESKRNEIRDNFSKWIKMDHGNNWGEAYYSLIEPVIFQEKYLADLRDIKVFCFNGQPKFFQIDRHFAEHRMNFYDLNWKPLTWLSRMDYPANYAIQDTKPPIELIIEYASKLCKPFKFVRCDFIISGGNIYGGELTFIPGAGNQSYLGDGDRKLGNMLDL